MTDPPGALNGSLDDVQVRCGMDWSQHLKAHYIFAVVARLSLRIAADHDTGALDRLV